MLAYGGRTEKLNAVTELMLTDRHASSRGISLLIRNNGRKIGFLSEALNKGTDMKDTSFCDAPTDDFVGRGFARLVSLAGSTHTLCPLLRGSLL